MRGKEPKAIRGRRQRRRIMTAVTSITSLTKPGPAATGRFAQVSDEEAVNSRER